MPLKIIGAGLGRTGTNSFRLAMNRLGFGNCHHMFEVIENPAQADIFLAAARGKATDWEKLFDGYQSVCDWPSCHFWRELSNRYPDAKIVLTTRDAESWYDSMEQTIFAHIREMLASPRNPVGAMVEEIVYRQVFDCNIDNRKHVIDVYENHNRAVRDAFPAERLLEFHPGDGWKPLCDFLSVDIPDEPYPKTNSVTEFRKKDSSLTGR